MIDAGCDIAWSTAWRPALRAWGPPSWRNFNYLFGVCAARVFPAWCGRGPNELAAARTAAQGVFL